MSDVKGNLSRLTPFSFLPLLSGDKVHITLAILATFKRTVPPQ